MCNTLTDEQTVEAIIDALDGARFDTQGGYPSQWVIENGKVYWASVDHGGGPDLTVLPVDEFIATYRHWLIVEAGAAE